MENQEQELKNTQPCRTGDPNSVLDALSPEQILEEYGHPWSLLSSSFKTQKCLKVGVLARVLYMTPGVLCSHATQGCLAACLGHCSGRMQMPTHALARDRRTALYLHDKRLFLGRLKGEMYDLLAEAANDRLTAALRLNGSSDLPWEDLHPEFFTEFAQVRFFDYTKNPARMLRFLYDPTWPSNYHLTFSAAPGNHHEAREILAAGGTVAVVFWPNIPSSFWGHPVINGDTHDARFLDPNGSVVALSAKGLAQADRTGFTVHVCPSCSHRNAA